MSYVWFNRVLQALGKRLNYESISNLYGNSFAKQSAKIIQGANPLHKFNPNNSGAGIMALAGSIKIIDANSSASTQSVLGDTSWAN